MMLRYFFLALTLAVIIVVSIAGFRGEHFTKPPFEVIPDMNYQDKVKDQVPSAFFADGNSARPPIPGTVAEEMPTRNDYWSTGKWDDTHWGDGIPVHDAVDGGRPLQIDAADMARGRERYSISCEVCHGAAGDGKGITSKYGLNGAASYHIDRLRQATDGQLFDTITNGKGQMLAYGYNITIDDRWRIVMYIRALQLSQNAQLADASPDEQTQLEKVKTPTASAPAPVPAETPAAPTQPHESTLTTNGAPASPPVPVTAPASTNGVPAAPATPPTKPPGMASNPPPLPAGIPAGSTPLMTTDSHGKKVQSYVLVDGGRHKELIWLFPYPKPSPPDLKRVSSAPHSVDSGPPITYLSQKTIKGWIDIYY